MEVLSDILRSMRVQGSVYFCDHVEPPWTKTFADMPTASFHLVRRGECWLTCGERVERLGAGDLVFLGPGIDHELKSDEGASTPTLLLCGYCGFDGDALTPMLSVFPELTIVREDEFVRYPWLKGTFDQLSSEYMSQGPGSELVVNKLTEVIIIELIRINFARDATHSFLAALGDSQISAALQLLHEFPGKPWTLKLVAGEVGVSRASFAARFKRLVGQPMFQYLTNLRMQKAKLLLRDTRAPLYEVGELVGYESDLAFTKTFKKIVGVTPTQYRRDPPQAA